tara:strand:+ start:7859 stop:8257 length:399 start_codon:yes stop_codon:yes gene_type:complete
VTAYETLDASEKRYVAVRGSFTFDGEGAPEHYDENAPEEWLTSGHVSGEVLTADGFTTQIDRDIVVVIGCVGPWCAVTEPSEDALMFLRQEAGGAALYLDVGACAPNVFPRAKEADFEAMEACMAGDCPPVE